MELSKNENYSFEIVRYEPTFKDGQPKITIEQIKLLKDGKYVKFVKLHEVWPYLSMYPVTFKKLKNE